MPDTSTSANIIKDYLNDVSYAINYAKKTTTNTIPDINIGQTGNTIGGVTITTNDKIAACCSSNNKHNNDFITKILSLRNPENINLTSSGSMLNGVTAYGHDGSKITGCIATKNVNNMTYTQGTTHSCGNYACNATNNCGTITQTYGTGTFKVPGGYYANEKTITISGPKASSSYAGASTQYYNCIMFYKDGECCTTYSLANGYLIVEGDGIAHQSGKWFAYHNYGTACMKIPEGYYAANTVKCICGATCREGSSITMAGANKASSATASNCIACYVTTATPATGYYSGVCNTSSLLSQINKNASGNKKANCISGSSVVQQANTTISNVCCCFSSDEGTTFAKSYAPTARYSGVKFPAGYYDCPHIGFVDVVGVTTCSDTSIGYQGSYTVPKGYTTQPYTVSNSITAGTAAVTPPTASDVGKVTIGAGYYASAIDTNYNTGTALAGDILKNKTAINSTGKLITGTIESKTASDITLGCPTTALTGCVCWAKGYYSAAGCKPYEYSGLSCIYHNSVFVNCKYIDCNGYVEKGTFPHTSMTDVKLGTLLSCNLSSIWVPVFCQSVASKATYFELRCAYTSTDQNVTIAHIDALIQFCSNTNAQLYFDTTSSPYVLGFNGYTNQNAYYYHYDSSNNWVYNFATSYKQGLGSRGNLCRIASSNGTTCLGIYLVYPIEDLG